jgi:hypothetical protein
LLWVVIASHAVNEIEPSLVEVLIEVPDAHVDAEGRLLTLEVDRKLSICTVDELVAGDVLHLDQPAYRPAPVEVEVDRAATAVSLT